MMRRTPVLFVAALCLAVLSAAADVARAVKAPMGLQLRAGARVGIVNLLDAQVTHFHESRKLEDSFLKTYTVSYSVTAMLLGALRDGLTQRGLAAVAVGPSDALRRSRETCFLDAHLAKGLPQECGLLFAQLATTERLDALIVLGPGRNDSAHAAGTRHRELPEDLRGWCFVTGAGGPDTPPTLLNLSELLLVEVGPRGAQLDDLEWGGDGQSWTGYRPPTDLKAFPDSQLAQLQPLFSAMLQQQANKLLAQLQVTR